MEKCSVLSNHKRNLKSNISFFIDQISKNLKKNTNTFCWQGGDKKGTSIYHLWECQPIQSYCGKKWQNIREPFTCSYPLILAFRMNTIWKRWWLDKSFTLHRDLLPAETQSETPDCSVGTFGSHCWGVFERVQCYSDCTWILRDFYLWNIILKSKNKMDKAMHRWIVL